MRHPMLSLGLLLAIVCGGTAPQVARGEDPATETPTAEQVEAWIAGLDADQFLARERAMNELIAAGGAVIEPVTAATLAGGPEVSVRGIHILLELAMGDDEHVGDRAVDALDSIGQSENQLASNEANSTLGELAVHREQRAISELERLGAIVTRSQIQINFQVLNRISNIEIGENWRGEPEDLRHLRWLTQTLMLTLNSPQVTDEHLEFVGRMDQLQGLQLNRASITIEGFEQLRNLQNLRQLVILYSPLGDEAIDQLLQMPNLQHIRLYGTGFSLEGAQRLRDNLGAISVDIRRGAFLGVSCGASEEGCRLNNVTAGSAADRAGLQVGDIILQIAGEDVASFPGLTELVSKYGPGDTVEISGTRQGEAFTCEVEFGEWED